MPHHDKVPNLKLVMNPEGKLHDWTDVPEDELPELQQIASGGPSAEIAHNVVENLQTCKGRGICAIYFYDTINIIFTKFKLIQDFILGSVLMHIIYL